MTRDELFHDPLLAHPEEVIGEPESRTPERRETVDERRETVDRPSQRSLELLRVQDELKKMARASRRG